MNKFSVLVVKLIVITGFILPNLSFAKNNINSIEKISINSNIVQKLWSSKNTIEFLDDFPVAHQRSICKLVNLESDDHQIIVDDEILQKELTKITSLKTYECKSNESTSFLSVAPSILNKSKIVLGGGIYLKDKIFVAQKSNLHGKGNDFIPITFDPISGDCGEELPYPEKRDQHSLLENLKNYFGIKSSIAQQFENITKLTIAVDTDYELFTEHKSHLARMDQSVTDSDFIHNFLTLVLIRNNVIEMMGLVNSIYNRSISTAFQLGNLYLYTQANDPWQQNFDAETVDQNGVVNNNAWNKYDLLDDIRDYWGNNRINVRRSLVWFLSGNGGGGLANIGYKYLSGTNEIIPDPINNIRWYMENDIDPVEINDQDFFGLNNLWRYGGMICNQNYGFSLTGGAQSSPFLSNILTQLIAVVAHETGHNFGSPHTRCYNPPVDRYGWEGDRGGCNDRINPNLSFDFESTLMSYAPVRRMEFANPVINEMRENLSRVISEIQQGAHQSCGLSIIQNQLPRLVNDLTINPQPVINNQPITFSFVADDDDSLIVNWDLENLILTSRCNPNQVCSITHRYFIPGFRNINIEVIDKNGESFNIERQLRVFGAAEDQNQAPVVEILSLEGEEVVFENGFDSVSPIHSFNLRILATDRNSDPLVAEIYVDNNFKRSINLDRFGRGAASLRMSTAGRHTLKVIVNDSFHETERAIDFVVRNIAPEIVRINHRYNEANNSYQFTASVTDLNGNSDLSRMNYRWEFSDGVTILQNGMTALNGISHTFQRDAAFTGKSVLLTVTDPSGASASKRYVVLVPFRFPDF